MSLKYKLDDMKYKIKYAWQRVVRGYDDRVVWNLNTYFLEYVPKILKQMNDNRCGFPPQLTDDKWSKTLNKMIECFTEANEDTCSKKNKYQAKHDQMWEDFTNEFGLYGDKLPEQAEYRAKGEVRMFLPSDKEVGHKEWAKLTKQFNAEERKIEEYRDKKLHEGLDLFNEHFWNLWD